MLLKAGASRNVRATYQNRVLSAYEAALCGQHTSIANILQYDPSFTSIHDACEEGKVRGSDSVQWNEYCL